MLFSAPLLAAILLAATPTLTLPGQVADASAVHNGPVGNAFGDGFRLSGGTFRLAGTERRFATAVFSGVLENMGNLRNAQIEAGFARVGSATELGAPIWPWRNQVIVESTPGQPQPIEISVSVPEMLSAGLGRRYYEPRWTVQRRPPDPDLPPDIPETMESYIAPASRIERLGFVIDHAQIELSTPGLAGNQATFTGRLRSTGTEKEARVRAGVLRTDEVPDAMRWYMQRMITVPAPPEGRSRDFELTMPAPTMLHAGLMRGAYTAAVEIVGENEPAPLLPLSATDVYQADEGIELAHWLFDLTHPGETSNTAIFSGSVENTGSEVMDVAVRAGFEPAGQLAMGGEILDKSHWPWQGEVLLEKVAPGERRAFTLEFAVPPRMDVYLRIPSYYPRILLRRPPR